MARSDVRLTVRALRGTADRVMKRLALSVNAELIEATPVDTGFARASWIASIGSPSNAVAGSRDEIDRAAQSAAQARLLVYTVRQGDIWISNNVQYIGELNEGHSPQAPAGFIEDAIRRGVARVIT